MYDYSHIGHARTYIAFDAFVKYLRSQAYNVRYIQNITDIDDKIIDRAKKLKEPPKELARTFETEYYHDMEALEINSVDKYARATDYIPQIISQIERLINGGYAYEISNDGIYFDISKFSDYGKLSRRTVRQAEDAVSRIDESVKKKNRGDFALWKYSKPGEPVWRPAPPKAGRRPFVAGEPRPPGAGGSPQLQPGRPGWHIEDTAITETELEVQYDIHGGARDLIFPHHESEIAQMEALSGKKPLVNYWMHSGFLTINGEKMAKSLGNFITIHEFLREHSKETFRLFILSSHYRSPVDYNEGAVRQAEANVNRISELFQRLEKITTTIQAKAGPGPALKQQKQGLAPLQDLTSAIKKYKQELDDDFNTPKALAVVFNIVRDANALLDKQKINPEGTRQILQFLKEVNLVFGIIQAQKSVPIPKKVQEFAKQREELRRNKKWADADKVRAQIEEMGYIIKDTPKGPEIKKRRGQKKQVKKTRSKKT